MTLNIKPISTIEMRHLPDDWDLELVDDTQSYLDNLSIQLIKELLTRSMTRMMSSANVVLTQPSVIKVKQKDFVNSLLKFITIKRSRDGMILFTDPSDSLLLTNNPSVISRIIRSIDRNQKYDVIWPTDSISKLSRDVFEAITNDDYIEELNELPNHLILTDDYRVFNTSTREYDQLSNFSDYDFLFKCNWQFVDNYTFNAMSKGEKSKFKLYTEMSKRIVDGWCAKSDDLTEIDIDKRTQLLQIQIAAIQGNSRGRYVELLGSGGNGKSTLLDTMKLLVGSHNTVELNLSQIADDNRIGAINTNTRLVIGHEIATHYRFSPLTTSRYKELATSDPISICEKYAKARIIKFSGLGIQSCNTAMTFPENTAAIRARRFPIKMSSIDFRKREDLKIDIKSYMNDKLFRSAYATMIFNECEDFKDFLMTEDTFSDIDELTKDGDHFSMFIDEEAFKFIGIKFLSTTALYPLYQRWSSKSGFAQMSKSKFTSKLDQYLSKYGYVLSQSTQRLSFNENRQDVNNMYSYIKLLTGVESHQSRYHEKQFDFISIDDIKSVKSKLLNNDVVDLADTERIILSWIATNHLDSDSSLALPYLKNEGFINE